MDMTDSITEPSTVTGTCHLCNDRHSLIEGTVAPDRGSTVGTVLLCENCWDRISTDRCGICGDRVTGPGGTVGKTHGGGTARFCGPCREIIDHNQP